MKKKNQLFWLVLIAGFYLASSLFRLGSVPPGVNNDEAIIGYDAYSIWTTGRDHWGRFLPIEFQSFGDYKLPVYSYMAAPIVGLLGLSVFSVRLLSVLAGLGGVVLTYLLGKKIFSFRAGLLSAGGLAVTPYFFGMSRIAVECSLALFFILLGVYIFLAAPSAKGYFFSALAFGISLFTYHSSRVLVPFLVVAMVFERFKSLKGLAKEAMRYFKKETFWSFAAALLVALVILVTGKVFLTGGGSARLGQIGILKNITILDRANMSLGSCRENFSAPICRIFDNKYIYYAGEYIHNYLSQFSLNFLFLNKDNTKGVLPPVSYFQISMLPFLSVGIYNFLREFKSIREGKKMLVMWLLSAPLGASLAGPGSYSRSFVLIFPLIVFAGLGLDRIIHWSRKLAYIAIGLCLFETIAFFLAYFSYFPKYNSNFTHYEYQPLMRFMSGYLKDKPDTPVYISSRYRDTKQYIFLLFYQSIPPKEFQQNKDNVILEKEPDGWIWVKQVNNWHFVKSIPSLESLPDGAILIGSQKEEIAPMVGISICPPYRVDRVSAINFLNGDPAFEIVRFTKEENKTPCAK